jgi:hypothetical protein
MKIGLRWWRDVLILRQPKQEPSGKMRTNFTHMGIKLNLDERLARGVAITYTHENRRDCPASIEKILSIPDLSSVFRVEDFIAIQRKPRDT